MQKFDIVRIGRDHYLIVQAEHLLQLSSVVVLPVLPKASTAPLSKLTVDVSFDDERFSIRAHMPLTIDARMLRHCNPVHRLSADEGQQVMDALNTILWGF